MLSDHLTLRVNPELRQELQRKARQRDGDVTAVARRYIAMDRYPGIVFRDTAYGRSPFLAGTRLAIGNIIATYRGSSSVEQAANYFPIPVEDMTLALDYYADHLNEIDSWIDTFEEDNEREYQVWLRRQSTAATR